MATRNKKKSSMSVVNNLVLNKHVENSWVLLMKDSLFQNNNITIITLPHPGHGKPTKFCLDNDNKKIYEVIRFCEPHRSWFIGESVKSDGTLLIASPFNPIFLVLPRLRDQCMNRAVPIEDLLSEKGFSKIFDFINNLDSVADLKGQTDMKAYKYNEEKTLMWLESRVRKLSTVLRQKNIHVTTGAVSATFVASTISSDNVDEEFYLKYAHGIISEYLESELADLLEKRFEFKPDLIESIGKKRKSEVEDTNNSSKRMKSDTSDTTLKEIEYDSNTSVEQKKQKPLTAKEKARQKAASGTKTISSFFTKK